MSDTIEQVKKEIEALEYQMWINSNSDDFYHSYGGYDKDNRKLLSLKQKLYNLQNPS